MRDSRSRPASQGRRERCYGGVDDDGRGMTPVARVEGKVALVTGAASGIGRACARLLAAEGAKVVLSDIDADGGRAAAAEVGDALFLEHDVTDPDAWQAAVEQAMAVHDGLHILVQSAGVALNANVEDTSLDDWRRVHAVDLDGVFLGCRAAIPALRASGGGAIVNISSVSGIVAGHNLAAYNSAKAGVRLLSKSVALHCARARTGIRCNSVHPTFIDTPMLAPILEQVGDDDRGRAKLARQVPLGRIGAADDVAYAVLYLASDEAAFVTGAELVVDGGLSAM